MANSGSVTTTTLHRDDASIEYVLRGPTAGSLTAHIERIKQSFQRSDIVVGQPYMVAGGDVEVRVQVFR